MPIDPPPSPEPLVVRHHPWTGPLRRPRMANDEDVRPGVALTSRYLVRHGSPVVPVSGELHLSRVPRHRWSHRLRRLRSGGVTVVATYVFWLHHVAERGRPRFDGNLDVAAFVDRCAAEGLDVILRIGPWVHGESRNGGFPDWVQHAPVRHRTDDPAYLELVREWFGQLAAALDGRCGPAGTVLGVQLENELYDQPGHLVTLKRLAREAGLSAPLWTATAWGSADLPADEVLPLYGGYGDGFWVDADAPWDPTFRDHYFFSHVWDDPGIGADVRKLRSAAAVAGRPRTPSEDFPPATCELGGGMATAYHRRPRPAALDIAAIAHCKIGNGSAWQGYYMYAGGTNPPGTRLSDSRSTGTQESHATGYPNDLPRLGYDFHAPIGEAGLLAPSHAELRRQHAFLAAFGASLAEMPSSLPVRLPAGVEDSATLRWALRSDGDTGFVFISWHQPHMPLPPYRDARFRLALSSAEVVMPSRPVDIPPGTLARWPIRFTAGGVRLDWVTASALTLLSGPVPTLVLIASAGIETEYAIDGRAEVIPPSLTPTRVTTASGALDLLVLPNSADVWVAPGPRLLLSAGDLAWGADGRIEAYGPDVRAYDPALRAFAPRPMQPSGSAGATTDLVRPVQSSGPGAAGAAPIDLVRPAGGAVPMAYGKFDGRQSAPSPEVFDELAAVYRVHVPDWAASPGLDIFLTIDWAGDVAELRVDGHTVTDRFWDGSAWQVSLRDVGYHPAAELTLHVLPLAGGSTVSLPPEARDRLLAADGQLLAVDRVGVTGHLLWHETGPSRTVRIPSPPAGSSSLSEGSS